MIVAIQAAVITGVAADLLPARESPMHVAAPPAPPVEIRSTPSGGGVSAPSQWSGPPALYSIGQPSDEEQLYVEWMNRARANPAAEAERLRDIADADVLSAVAYFNVDLNLMASQIAGLSPAPPLSIHPGLTTAARLHSGDMFTNAFQGHYSSAGKSPGDRITAQGYGWSRYGENVYASARSVIHGHAGFEIDWGNGPGGMQTPAGHRLNIHDANYREVGVGVVNGSNGGVGPQLVTQDLASRSGLSPFVTGVVYYDFNGNGFYDVGEGIGGVQVTASSSTFFAITADSGGYSVPAPAGAPASISFSAPGIPTHQAAVTVGSVNVKVDYAPAYTPPVVSGPALVGVGQSATFTLTPVGGATEHQWKHSRRVAGTLVEGAENGLADVTAQVTAGYSILDSQIAASGSRSFHLAHLQAVDQVLTLNRTVRLAASSRLVFAARLGWATPAQVARAQVSFNGGADWMDLWSRPGTGNAGQSAFARYTNDLGGFAGEEAMVRFVYDFTDGAYYYQSSQGVGLYLDDITLLGSEELVDVAMFPAGTESTMAFAPQEAGDYVLRARARVGGRWLSWGPEHLVSASVAANDLQVRIKGPPVFSGGRALLEIEVLSGVPGSFEVQTASTPAGPWTPDASATVQTVQQGALYRANATRGNGSMCFYRIAAW